MNIKEAEEVVKAGMHYLDGLTYQRTQMFAKGFLEGFAEAEKKAEVLVEALHKIMMLPTRTDRKQFDYENIAERALSQYQDKDGGGK